MRAALLPKETGGVRVVQARLRLHYGDQRSMAGQETVGAFVAAMLDKGAAGMTRQQISDAFDKLRAEVGLQAEDQTLTASITTTKANLPAVVEHLGKLLREPVFPADALEETRRQWLTSIERQRKEPSSLIANTLQRHDNPYPRGDLRYASTFDEMVQDVDAVTVEKLKDFHRRFYSAARSESAQASGDQDPVAVKQALEHAFGDWKQPAAGPLPYVRVPLPLVPVKAERFMLVTPDKQNANLRAELSLPINDLAPDYPAMLMANYLFGSGGTSRLWTRVREKEGLSYDVRSVVDWNPIDENSRFAVTAIFAPQNQPKVEAALREETARALKDGFTQAELDQARVGLLNLRRLSRAQDAVVAGQLAQNLYLRAHVRGLAAGRRDAIRKLTLADVNAAFRKYVDPARWAIAWGGDFKPPQ